MNDRAGIFAPERYAKDVAAVVDAVATALEAGRRVYWMGNGGSAAEAQHLAAEFSGRFLRERRGLASEAFNVNASTITAIGNDFSYDEVYSRQVEAFVVPGDVVIGMTTSGTSKNIVRARETARAFGAVTIAFTGNGGGTVMQHADHAIVGPDGYSAIVQEVHLVLGHVVCDLVEQRIMAREAASV